MSSSNKGKVGLERRLAHRDDTDRNVLIRVIWVKDISRDLHNFVIWYFLNVIFVKEIKSAVL